MNGNCEMLLQRAAEEEEERLRQRKLEEALEIQSLRRIISAYLNYPEAAEQDVKKCERSYRKLPPSHKALLRHYPSKLKKLRRCISVNSYFIYNMLQAFEPPLDMTQSHSNSDSSRCHSNGYLKPEEASDNLKVSERELREIGDEDSVGAEKNKCISKRHFPDVELDQEKTSTNPSEGCCAGNRTDKEYDMTYSSHDWLNPSIQMDVPLADVDKVRCIVRNIVRDWSAEGQKERDQCYKPILEELGSLFPHRQKENPPSCLVPGAGLGRLAMDISCLGFLSQGNEFSYYMMICSSFILNNSQSVGEWTMHPWIHSNCNSLTDDDQLRPVRIPDVHPASAGITDGFSMCGGDFVEVFNDPSQVGAWDSVVTCFFIDTAHNVVEYIEIISKILKDGGVWINFGPLLYHYADAYGEDEMSVELSLEDVKRVAIHFGFEVLKESTVETTYSTNPHSMMQNRYFAAFWTMRKKPSG